jgi:hypothetical protein
MPGYSYGIPAQACVTGGKLREVAGSTCATCYAFKGNYRYGNVQASQERRKAALPSPAWVTDFVALLTELQGTPGGRFFRWHDAGDIQSLEHLDRIVEIARQVPGTRFWLPTREYGMVTDWRRTRGEFPANLIVRVSAPMIGGEPPFWLKLPTSTVDAGVGFGCPAPQQDGYCGGCRACWSKNCANVDYHKH